MYSDIINLLQTNGYYNKVALKSINNSHCSTCNSELLDFINIKKKFSQAAGYPQSQSVDGIGFCKKNKLHFVRTEPAQPHHANREAITIASTYLNDNDIKRKIDGTVRTLSTMIKYYGLFDDMETLCSKPKRDKIDTYVVLEMNDRTYVELVIGHLNLVHTPLPGNPIVGQLKLINCVEYEKVFA